MRTKQMAALLLMLGMVVLSIGVGATVNSADAESPASIKVIGRGAATVAVSLFGGDRAAINNARMGASNAGAAAVIAAAKAACPDGYTIVPGSAAESYNLTLDYIDGWPYYTCTYLVTMEIECWKKPDLTVNDDDRFPAPPKWPGEYRPMTAAAIEESNKALVGHYEELKQIKTPEQLISLVESNKVDGVDYSLWERAKRDGKITKVNLPSLEELSKTHVERKPENR